jgi:hypothetical protein
MESEKVKEIKETLRRCGSGNVGCCWGCSLEHNRNIARCTTILCEKALTLINELESENESLKKDNELLRNAKVVYENVDYCYEDLKKAEDRIAELEKENAIKTDTIVDLLKKQEFYEKEKLTKFAEMLKEKCDYMDSCDYGKKGVFINNIDETLKEFIER